MKKFFSFILLLITTTHFVSAQKPQEGILLNRPADEPGIEELMEAFPLVVSVISDGTQVYTYTNLNLTKGKKFRFDESLNTYLTGFKNKKAIIVIKITPEGSFATFYRLLRLIEQLKLPYYNFSKTSEDELAQFDKLPPIKSGSPYNLKADIFPKQKSGEYFFIIDLQTEPVANLTLKDDKGKLVRELKNEPLEIIADSIISIRSELAIYGQQILTGNEMVAYTHLEYIMDALRDESIYRFRLIYSK